MTLHKKRVYAIILCIYHSMLWSFGGNSISVELYEFICKTLQPGQIILELGSGEGTGELAKYFTMVSIEHDKKWLNKYTSTYIYAPFVRYKDYAWYNIEEILKKMPKQYDLILVDGPPGNIGRYGFFHYLNSFNHDVTIIFDDVQREAELKLLIDVAQKLNRAYTIYLCADEKQFGVIDHVE